MFFLFHSLSIYISNLKFLIHNIFKVEQCKDALGIPIARFNMELHEDSELGSDSGRIYHLEAESVKICREWIDVCNLYLFKDVRKRVAKKKNQ